MTSSTARAWRRSASVGVHSQSSAQASSRDRLIGAGCMRRGAFGKMRCMEMSATTAAGAPLRVLMVCYHFPPMSPTGSLRVARFAKYLPADIAVEVLTVANPPEETGNRALLAELAGRVTIHKAALPARFTQRWVESAFAGVPLGGLLSKALRTLLTFTLWIPDWQVRWRQSALHTGGRLLGGGNFDVMFCS